MGIRLWSARWPLPRSSSGATMIRVLSVIDTCGPGGAETVFLQTVTRLDPARFRAIAVVGGSGWLTERLASSAVEHRVVPAKGSFNVRYLSALSRIARRGGTDIIVAHLYGSAIYASLLGALASIPVVSILHGQTDVSASGRLATLKSVIVRRGSRKVVFVSERLRDYLEPRLRLRASQSVVIPNGVDTDAFRPLADRTIRRELGIDDETALIGAVGNVRRPKAYDVLLKAMQILLSRGRRIHLVIAGDSSNALGAELLQLRRDLGIERHVTFLGLRSDVAKILNNLDVFVLSSHTEGFSIACVEAMACGVPVVATRSGGPEQVLEGEAGILVPTGNPAALAAGIERAFSEEGLAARLVNTAAKRVRRHFSLAGMLSRYEELLASLVAPGVS